MQQTNEMFCDYNKNLLSNDFLNTNNAIVWDVSNPSLNFNIEYSTDKIFTESSLLINCNGGTTNDTFEFNPSENSDYTTMVSRSGKYIFSFKALYEKFAFDTCLDCEFYLISNISGIVKTFKVRLGNIGGSVPNTFIYDKWLTFFEECDLISGHTYQIIAGKTTIKNHYVPLLIYAYFDGFKLEFIKHRNQDIPSYYTKPQI